MGGCVIIIENDEVIVVEDSCEGLRLGVRVRVLGRFPERTMRVEITAEKYISVLWYGGNCIVEGSK